MVRRNAAVECTYHFVLLRLQVCSIRCSILPQGAQVLRSRYSMVAITCLCLPPGVLRMFAHLLAGSSRPGQLICQSSVSIAEVLQVTLASATPGILCKVRLLDISQKGPYLDCSSIQLHKLLIPVPCSCSGPTRYEVVPGTVRSIRVRRYMRCLA